MILAEKRTVANPFTAIDGTSLHLLERAFHVDRTNPSEIKASKLRGSKLTFVEDFTLEHTLLGLRSTSIELSAFF